MSELLKYFQWEKDRHEDQKKREVLFGFGVETDPGWTAYDQDVEAYSHAFESVLFTSLQTFIDQYREQHGIHFCSVIDYMGTGVVRNLRHVHGVSVSLSHPPNQPGRYIDGDLLTNVPWKQIDRWLEQDEIGGENMSPFADISISRALLGVSGMVTHPEPFGILLRRAYRRMHPERGVFVGQFFLKPADVQRLDSWKYQLNSLQIDLFHTENILRLDRHTGSPYNLPYP